MIIVGKLFYYYKLLYRKLFYYLFYTIRKIIILINGKDIVEILNSTAWRNAKSVLFFYTNILTDKISLNVKNYPVKRFRVKWYIWLIYYIWAGWVIIKIIAYMTVFYSFIYFKSGFWKHIWLVLLEYWRLRLNIFVWVLHITWLIMVSWSFARRLAYRIHRDKSIYLYVVLRFLKVYKYWKTLILKMLMYFWLRDKWPYLGY